MATNPKNILFAAVGLGDAAISKVRDVSELRNILSLGANAYSDFVQRGEQTIASIKAAAPTKRAIAQAKSARTQTKSAVTSVRKATATSASAARDVVSGV